MALTALTVATTEAAATAYTFSGVYKFRADQIPSKGFATLYEETTTDDAYVAARAGGGSIILDEHQPSAILELYGKYKWVVSDAAIEVGYAS